MHLDKGFRLLFIPAALAALLGAFNADDKMLRKAAEAINGSAYRAHVVALSADDFEGRDLPVLRASR